MAAEPQSDSWEASDRRSQCLRSTRDIPVLAIEVYGAMRMVSPGDNNMGSPPRRAAQARAPTGGRTASCRSFEQFVINLS